MTEEGRVRDLNLQSGEILLELKANSAVVLGCHGELLIVVVEREFFLGGRELLVG